MIVTHMGNQRRNKGESLLAPPLDFFIVVNASVESSGFFFFFNSALEGKALSV